VSEVVPACLKLRMCGHPHKQNEPGALLTLPGKPWKLYPLDAADWVVRALGEDFH